jgi:hypothetical protein
MMEKYERRWEWALPLARGVNSGVIYKREGGDIRRRREREKKEKAIGDYYKTKMALILVRVINHGVIYMMQVINLSEGREGGRGSPPPSHTAPDQEWKTREGGGGGGK